MRQRRCARWRNAGASDAATVRAVAAALGADVPYFLEGGTVLGLDRGDRLFRLAEPPRRWVVLVLPDFGVSTKDAFAWLDAIVTAAGRRSFAAASAAFKGRRYETRRWSTIFKRRSPRGTPRLLVSCPQLRRAGASHAAMSGSGSAVFGLFSARETAVEAAIG